MELAASTNQLSSGPKISVVIPVFNAEKYLNECLESCSKQTLEEIEFLAVNDGSTDRSQIIIDQFAAKDPRFVSIIQKNRGAAAARNNGLRNARGEVIMFLDSDDYLAPPACETVWNEYINSDPDIIVFGTNIIADEAAILPWLKRTLTSIRRKAYSGPGVEVLFREPSAKPFVWRNAFKKSFISENELVFDEELWLTEDIIFQMEAFPHAKSILFIPEKLYNYRWGRSGSVMDITSDLKIKLPIHLLTIDHVIDYWKNHDLIDLHPEDFIPWAFNFVLRSIISEDIRDAKLHLETLIKIVDKHALLPYLEKLSPELYKSFLDISETIRSPELPEPETLARLAFQLTIIRLQMKNEMAEKRIERLKNNNENLTEKLAQEKASGKNLTEKLTQEKISNKNLAEKLTQEKSSNKNLTEKLAQEKSSNKNLTEKLTQEKTNIKNIQEKLNREKTINEKLRKKLVQAENNMEAIYDSTSWKTGNLLIRPLHIIREAVNKIIKHY